MRISKVEFENFRNFRDHGIIRCSTDGKVTIIYGKNGDGKTTLHQLFQWIFYGQVHFNKTTTDRLYNLQFESELPFGETFDVVGCIDFEHAGKEYSLRRTHTYRKDLADSSKIAEDFTLSVKGEDYDWHRVENTKETVEKLLPSGLSDYFFFDGESMIADLRVKGKDSADKLRKALYSMFDLDVLEAAVNDIGRTDLKTTVLGKLYLSKGTISSGHQISTLKAQVENVWAELERIDAEIQTKTREIDELQELSRQISERIGAHKSKQEYQAQRTLLKKQRDGFLTNAASEEAHFGDAVFDMFPQLLLSRAVAEAKKKLNMKVEQTKLPAGVSKKLISYLLADKTTHCVCGRPLCQEERAHIEEYLNMLPPKSYSSLYQDFSNTAKSWSKGYDPERIEQCILSVLHNNEQAAECDRQIRTLDEEEKKSPDIGSLVASRQKAEAQIQDLSKGLEQLRNARTKHELLWKKKRKEFDEITKSSAAGQIAAAKIAIMEQVAAHFRRRKEEESLAYSQLLQSNIQSLIDCMLTSKRTVYVTPEFSVRVTDSYNDESKSEGQFAVVSFAYIGGILKMLRSEQHLQSKEYPLVLDGPFSKLDPDQRKNVVNMIPKFAPQVILFSKDDLHEVFNEKDIGRVWTIVSNDEKNVARVEEGKLWK